MTKNKLNFSLVLSSSEKLLREMVKESAPGTVAAAPVGKFIAVHGVQAALFSFFCCELFQAKCSNVTDAQVKAASACHASATIGDPWLFDQSGTQQLSTTTNIHIEAQESINNDQL